MALICLASMISACSRARDETVSGVTIPVPSGMEKVASQGVELSIPGFGGGQATFQGDIAPEKIIEFYQKEMPARGWQPGTSLLSRGGMLSYSNDGKNVLLAVSARDGKTSLTITVGNTSK
jgi:hypothetical protein